MDRALNRLQRERRVSVRVLWPFLRIIGSSPSLRTTQIFARAGIDLAALGRPDTRVPLAAVIEALQRWIEDTGDEEIGIRAAASVESIDLDVVDQVLRTCATLRDALECSTRYVHVLYEAADVSLVDRGDAVLWRFGILDGIPHLRAINDFVVFCAARFSVRRLAVQKPALEVHFMHPAPDNRDGYSAFRASVVRFGMEHNGFLLDRAGLDQPMPGANSRMRAVFESQARAEAAKASGGLRNRVRDEIGCRLGKGILRMGPVAATLGMSAATLRRRLEEEGTTFSALVDHVRRDLAEQYLRDPSKGVDEVAALVGFRHVPTFHRAFRRWTGVTPSEHRKRR
jgi:AraC-like DNA-binding protein